MKVTLHPHAKGRLIERGATDAEAFATITGGEQFTAKFGRTGFRRNFSFQRPSGRLRASNSIVDLAQQKAIGTLR